MSNECSTIVWKRDFGNSNRKVIAARLADHADDEGRGIWPSVERVAAQCNVSDRTVQRILSAFVDEGILIVVSEGGKGPGSTRRYDFDMRKVEAMPLAKWGPESHQNKGDTVSPLENGKGDSQSAKGDSGDEKGCHGVTQTVIEPPIEPSLEREAREEDDPKKIERDGWALLKDWPGFAGMPKEPALKVWLGLDAGDRAEAVRLFPHWLALLKAQKKTHIPAPSSYFGQKLWREVPEPAEEQPTAVVAPPFGPVWSAVRMRALLLTSPADAPPAKGFMATLLAQDDAKGRQARLTRQAMHGWPQVNRMHDAAESRRGITVAPALETLAALMEPVPVRGEMWQRWLEEHERRGWPWLPDPGQMPVVYFPVGGPDGLEAFEQAVRGNHDAGGREAAE